ncbi:MULTISPECIES: hypothetical protein [Providencia]|uniref:hypothetical protein n=1 Tax=Providencia TaxID=586 RepID=UPI0013E065DD|nr:hypothetical protein [Providencia rettgeri]QIF56486.1 hypothetical protein FVA69_02920 [Providencia sp. 1701011]QIF60535.1 hypothetical protein FVA70_02925 [Providencia sp. 1701091]
MSIKPELVERDELGYWAHSQIPVSEDGEYLKQWFDNNCLEICNVYMDGDIDESHPTFKRYFIDGDCDISGWVPSKPQGDGWFIGGIFESEDGPACSWLRPDVAKLKAKFLRAHKEAEKAAFEYFCACDVGDERIQASEVYERIRTATRIGG